LKTIIQLIKRRKHGNCNRTCKHVSQILIRNDSNIEEHLVFLMAVTRKVGFVTVIEKKLE
jgi:hypothetical protein